MLLRILALVDDLEYLYLRIVDQYLSGLILDHALSGLDLHPSGHIGNQVHIDYEHRGGGFVKIRFNNIDELENIPKVVFNYIYKKENEKINRSSCVWNFNFWIIRYSILTKQDWVYQYR